MGDEDDYIAWKPQTAVPMFKICTDCNANASASDCGALISDEVDVASTEDESTAVAGDSISVDNIAAAGDSISAVTDAYFDDFVDIEVPAKDGLSIPQLCETNIFDNSDFDELFKNFLS